MNKLGVKSLVVAHKLPNLGVARQKEGGGGDESMAFKPWLRSHTHPLEAVASINRQLMGSDKAKSLGLAFGLTFAIIHCACISMMALFGRDTTIFISNSLIHGIDITPILRMEVPLRDSIVGLVGTFVLGWIMGAMIAAFNNLFTTGKAR